MSHSTSGNLCSNPLENDIGRDACWGVQEEMKGSHDVKVNWSNIAENGVQLLVICLHMYCGMYQTFLAGGAILMYRIHLTLPYFSEQNRRHYISNGSTIHDYMPDVYKTSTVLCSTERFEKIKL